MGISGHKSVADTISIKGARTHNLKGIDVEIPRGALTVITGVSGSGKSSLAFDTLYAEGYRKYIDSLSTQARQLLEQVPRPEVDYIHGLSPVVAVEQDASRGTNPRSTLGSITEIADYARLLWSNLAEQRCPRDGARIVQRSIDDWVDQLIEEYGTGEKGVRTLLLAPWMSGKKSVIRGELESLKQRGWERLRVDGVIKRISDEDLLSNGSKTISIDIVVDRLVLSAEQQSRLADSLELAFKEGDRKAFLMVEDSTEKDGWKVVSMSQDLSCSCCGEIFNTLTVKSFSSNHPDGACETCGGLGRTLQFDPKLVIPDGSISLRKGAIKPWRIGGKRMIIRHNAILKQLAEQLPFDPLSPWDELDESIRKQILYGCGDRLFSFKLKNGRSAPELLPFEGVLADLEETRKSTSSDGLKARLTTYQISHLCPDCEGKRLNAVSRSALIGELSFDSFMSLGLEDALNWVRVSQKKVGEQTVQLNELWNGLESRLSFLVEVGLGYLSLDRSYASLSGGEAQRARLATQLGMGLVGVAYVLDEPTIGLHPRDTRRLIKTLLDLRNSGNAVVVVEHDAEVIAIADHLIEIGPGAGKAGGSLILSGTPESAKCSQKSITGSFLSKKRFIGKPVPTKEPTGDWIEIREAYEHNLRDLSVSIPVGLLTVVTGVSGSGKSTLINEVLGNEAARKLNRAKVISGKHKGIEGLELFERVVRVDQDPIGRSPRSNPATYTKLFDDLRRVFAQCPLSKIRGYGAGRFSFNVRGGRCERCQGDGQIKLDMHFLADVYAECPSCKGARYNRETLEVRYKGLSIADVLHLTVDDAIEVFQRHPKIMTKLDTMKQVGLGYLHLGQAANTLSGGEAQRLKLSLELGKRSLRNTLYILDEPTTGLHWVDVEKLIELLFKLRDSGHTVLLIEHNTDIICCADWIIDLGPGGGREGGELLFSGPYERLKDCRISETAKAMFD